MPKKRNTKVWEDEEEEEDEEVEEEEGKEEQEEEEEEEDDDYEEEEDEKKVVRNDELENQKVKDSESDYFVGKDEGWPIYSLTGTIPEKNVKGCDDPFGLSKENGLSPGPSLIACSGSDISLSRNASVVPNPNKQRGRYIIILPGILSLLPQTSKDITTEDFCGNDKSFLDGESKLVDQEIQNLSVDSNGDDVNSRKDSPKASKNTILGRIEGLATDKPTLVIPHPNGGSLIFQGYKVKESSSSLLFLSFKPKRGEVVCKDAVSSVILFGKATFTAPPGVDANDNAMKHEEHLYVNGDIRHYGGSERTIDGGKKTNKSKRAVSSTSRSPVLNISHEAQSDLPENSYLADEESDDSDSYQDINSKSLTTNNASVQRRSSRKIAKNNLSYALDDDLEDDVDENSDDNDENSTSVDEDSSPPKKIKNLNQDSNLRSSTQRGKNASLTEKAKATCLQPKDDRDETINPTQNVDTKDKPGQVKGPSAMMKNEKASKRVEKGIVKSKAKLKSEHSTTDGNEDSVQVISFTDSGDDTEDQPRKRKNDNYPGNIPIKIRKGSTIRKKRMEEDFLKEHDDDIVTPPDQRRRSQRSTVEKISYVLSDDDAGDDDENQNETDEASSQNSSLKGATINEKKRISRKKTNLSKPKNSQGAKARVRHIRKTTTKDEEEIEFEELHSSSSSQTESEFENSKKKATNYKSSKQTSRSTRVDMRKEIGRSKSKSKDLKGTSLKNDIVEDSDQSTSRELFRSGSRRRKRTPIQVNNSSQSNRKLSGTTNDEYGSFDFSAEDVAILSTPEKKVFLSKFKKQNIRKKL
jgi:hypothetical protein